MERAVSVKPWPLYAKGKNPRYSLNRKLVGPQGWSGQFGEEKISYPCCEWNPRSSNIQNVPTILSQLPYSASTIHNTQAANIYSSFMWGTMTFMFIAGYTRQGSRWKDAPCGPAVNTGWWPYVPPGHSWNLQLLVLPASAIPVFMEFASMTWTGKSVCSGAFRMLTVWPFYAVNLCVI